MVICGEDTLLPFLVGFQDDNLNFSKPLLVKLKILFVTYKGPITLSVVKKYEISNYFMEKYSSKFLTTKFGC